MNIDIRQSIINNFKGSSNDDMIEAINSSICEGDEITLPGLGVFFELLWNSSNDDEKDFILKKLENSLK